MSVKIFISPSGYFFLYWQETLAKKQKEGKRSIGIFHGDETWIPYRVFQLLQWGPAGPRSGGEDKNSLSCIVPSAAGGGGLRDPQKKQQDAPGRDGMEDSFCSAPKPWKMRKLLVKIDFENCC